MAEKKTTPVVIDDKEYTLEDMTAEQREALEHVADLDRKIANGAKAVRQMEGGRDFWVTRLKTLLEEPAEEIAAE